jgi:hypothetical protein
MHPHIAQTPASALPSAAGTPTPVILEVPPVQDTPTASTDVTMAVD